MKVAVVFVLLFAMVLCRPARKASDSSESSEEVVGIQEREGRKRTEEMFTSDGVCFVPKQRRPPAPVYRKQPIAVPLDRIKVEL